MANKCDLFSFAYKDYPFLDKQQQDDDPLQLESIRVKPNSNQFEIKLQFNEKNDTICKKKNNELTVHQNRPSDNNIVKFKVLKSNYLPETLIKYGLCYLTKKKKILDVVPVDKVFDFQIDFSQLDNDDDEKKEYSHSKTMITTTTNNSDIAKQNDEFVLSPTANEIQNFTLRYETNFDYSSWSHVNFCKLKEKSDKEKWKTLKLIKKDLKHLTGTNNKILDDSASSRYCLLPQELINKQMMNSGCEYESMDSVSLAKINRLQLSEKINKLLINCRVIPYTRLVNLLHLFNANNIVDNDIDEELVIKILQKSAMLVQGNWIVKSEILYPTATTTTTTNNLNELAFIHDFLSFSFTKKTQFKRKELSAQIRFPLDSLLLVLEKLARFDKNSRKWTFIYETDHEFLKKNPNVKEQQQLLWNIKSSQIFKNLNLQVEKFRVEKTISKKIDDEKSKVKLNASTISTKRVLRKKRVRII